MDNRERKRAYYEANRERIKARSRQWYWENLDRARARGREYQRQHREEAAARYRQWRSNPENQKKAKAWVRRWTKANLATRVLYEQRRRTLKLGRFVEDVDRRVLLDRYDGLCGWCNEPIDLTDFHVDHIVAIVHGGEHSYANTQPVHPACNYEKRTVLKERAA